MLFTIAIPTYNNAKTVSKAIESAICQDYKDEYEILIVNNASTDNTREVLSTYERDPKVRVLTNEVTVDMYENHNVCLKEAHGDYIVFLHSDDELFPQALTIFNERLKERFYPLKYILWGHSMLYDFQDFIRYGNQTINTVFSGSMSPSCFLVGGLTPSGTCYSRKSIIEIGGFPKMRSKITPCDWYILFWAAFNFFEFEMMDRMVLKRTVSSTGMAITKEEDDESVVDMFDILFERLNEEQRKHLLDIIYNKNAIYLINLLKNYYSKKQLLLARIRNTKRIFLLIALGFLFLFLYIL